MTHLSMLNKILLASILALFIVSDGFAQNKVDLELTVQSAAKSVRGGETFAYSLTVRNIGSVKATNVILVQDEEFTTPFAAYAPSKGTCLVSDFDRRVSKMLQCKLTDLEAGETVIVSIEMKVNDFGDVSITEESIAKNSASAALIELMKARAATLGKVSQIVGNADVAAEEGEENNENNHAPISVELLPSKNIPPRVEILSPKNEETFTRSSKRLLPVTFKIKAYDPDGTVEKVTVSTQQFGISVEYPENKYVIDGVKYSIKEVEENMPRFQKYFGGDAVKTGKDTYTFTLENPRYGLNVIFIEATDNGGRVGQSPVRLTVKGDNSIEFTKPLDGAIIKPNSDVVIEARTTLNDAKSAKFQLIGSLCCEEILMKQISQVGNVFRHQYIVKNATTGRYGFQMLLTEDTGAHTYSEGVSFTVTEKPTVKITCPKKPAVFGEGEKIPLDVEAADADGRIENISVSVNGEYGKFSWRTDGYLKNGYIDGLAKGTYTIIAEVKDDLDVETESAPLTIVVR